MEGERGPRRSGRTTKGKPPPPFFDGTEEMRKARGKAPSVASSRRSGRSVASLRQSEIDANRKVAIAALEKDHDDFVQAILLKEFDAKSKADDVAALQIQLRDLEEEEQRDEIKRKLHVAEKEFTDICRETQRMRIQLKFKETDLERQKQTLTTIATHEKAVAEAEVEDDDDSLSQDLSDEEEEDFHYASSPKSNDDDNLSYDSDRVNAELTRKLLDLRGVTYSPTTPPAPVIPSSELVSPVEPTTNTSVMPPVPPIKCSTPVLPTVTSTPSTAPQDCGMLPAIEQLAAVLTQAFGQANNNKSDGRSDKFMARQAIKLDLSPFDGNSEEWPIFIQQYRTVTKECGLSNVENLQRLQRCLKGEARECVRALLLSPENVEEVISVLEKRFGNPKLVVQRLVEQAQQLSPVKEGDHGGVLHFIDVVRNLSTTATAMNCTPFLSSPTLISQLVEKLPHGLQMEWAKVQSKSPKPYADLADVSKWLQEVSDAVIHLYKPVASSSTNKRSAAGFIPERRKKPQKSFAVAERKVSDKPQERKCLFCQTTGHHLVKCDGFVQLLPDDRWKWVRAYRHCFSCLNYGHSVGECRQKKTCPMDGCDSSHHRLLHKPTSAGKPEEATMGHAVKNKSKGRINLNVLPVILKGPKGSIEVLAMLDPGATITVIESKVAQQLGLEGPVKPLVHSGLHPSTAVPESRQVDLEILPLDGKKTFQLTGARTMEKLAPPYQSVGRHVLQKWNHLKNLNIVPFNDRAPSILIGQDHHHLCNTRQLVLGPRKAPAAGRTALGWVLMGRVMNVPNGSDISCHITERVEDPLHNLVKDFFSTESFGVNVNVELPRSKEDKKSLEIMERTLKRVGARWECGLLWKDEEEELPHSMENALKRLYAMERKMDSDPEFAEIYQQKMGYYFENNFARKLTSEEIKEVQKKTYYLAHFLATNPKKQNKKRFVLDAKSKCEGVSLNDALMVGPDQLKSLPATLFKFRERVVAVTADIQDMFHRVLVRAADATAQRFLWRGMRRDIPPDVYEMAVLIFGATCSSAIAQEAKNRNDLLYEEEFPEAVDAIINRHYMDDYLDSLDSTEEALCKYDQVRRIQGEGGFNLRNWLSNSKEFMSQIPEDMRAADMKKLEVEGEVPIERVLGLFWNHAEDLFTFSLSYLRAKEDILTEERMPMKREALALIMSIYDPLGFLSPFVIRAKILLQDTWRCQTGWDDELPSAIGMKWNQWLQQLPLISEFRLSRCYSTYFSSSSDNQLHVFVDASEQAFGASAYFRIKKDDGVDTALVSSKTRVAPIKPLSIPRMELQAAVMGVRLANFIKEEHTVSIHRTVYWSDSRTVLSWIKGDGRNFKQFVSHRVGEIQEASDIREWRWIPTKENVADDLTRDAEACDLTPDGRWVTGPAFLKLEEDQWPAQPLINHSSPEHDDVELKRSVVCTAVALESPFAVEDYSSWSKLIRVTAQTFRAVKVLKNRRAGISTPPLSLQDLRDAEVWWIVRSQQESFPTEIECLKEGKAFPKESRLGRLQVTLDPNGILRLIGRLEKTAVASEEVKFPVVLDDKHPYTRILIDEAHRVGGHHGQERVVNELRQRFHILHIRSAVRSSWSRCQRCRNQRAAPKPPLMGQLPTFRAEYGAHPFTKTGVDYFGPLDVTVGRRREKRWCALFTCLTTRAVHLEIAGSLSTDSCIMAINRFTARRGCPTDLYSDNGTNFKGANNELKRALTELNQTRLEEDCQQKGISWHFNPPSAPHMGGSWERLVRSVKVALYATLKVRVTREEVLHTLLLEAEHCVNSHPLTHVSIDPEDEEALTPNHFLLGRSSNRAPPGIFEDGDLCLKKLWRRAQRLADYFWSRWLREYLPTLQQRQKWKESPPEVKIGDVVLEVDYNQPRGTWPKGVVVKTFPGGDGVVRVVDIKTASGVYKRPVVKLAVLDVRRPKEEGVAAPDVSIKVGP